MYVIYTDGQYYYADWALYATYLRRCVMIGQPCTDCVWMVPGQLWE